MSPYFRSLGIHIEDFAERPSKLADYDKFLSFIGRRGQLGKIQNLVATLTVATGIPYSDIVNMSYGMLQKISQQLRDMNSEQTHL